MEALKSPLGITRYLAPRSTTPKRYAPLTHSDLHRGQYQLCNQRIQFKDAFGEYVLTDPALLPPGGQSGILKSPRPVRFVFAGDFGERGDHLSSVTNSLKKELDRLLSHQIQPIVVGLGDFIYPHGPTSRPSKESDYLFEIFKALTPITQIAPVYGILGNHEYGSSQGPGDPGLFISMANEAGIKMPGRYYHLAVESAQHPVVDCFFLDTTPLIKDERQLHWLDQGLKNSLKKEQESGQKRQRFIIGHHPPKCAGLHKDYLGFMETLLSPALAMADAYIAGHEHELQALGTAGQPPIFVSGTGSDARSLSEGHHPDILFRSNAGGFLTAELAREGSPVFAFKNTKGAYLYQNRV